MNVKGTIARLIFFGFIVGSLVLLSINSYGLLFPNKLYHQFKIEKRGSRFHRYLPPMSVASLRRRAHEPYGSYVQRLTDSVNGRIYHVWKPDVSTRVSIFDNYVLYFLGYLKSDYSSYEFRDAGHALRRGYGVCSQAAFIVQDILGDQGDKVGIWDLKEHVVVQTTAGSKSWILDADYGVVVPYGMKAIKKDPDIIRPYYAKYYPGKTLDRLIHIYGRRDSEYYPEHTFDSGSFKTIDKERLAYALKWLIPIFGLAIGVFGLWRARRH